MPWREQGLGLARHQRARLAEERAPLAVADDRVAAAELAQHAGRDLAGEGALLLGVHVLRGERDRVPASAGPSAASAVKGGASTTSTPRTPATSGSEGLREGRPPRATVLCIFQFAARIGVGASRRSSAATPGSVETLHVLERRAAARREVADAARRRRACSPRRASRRRRRPSARLESATARATASVPFAKASISNTPIGPFQKIVRARLAASAA